MLLLALGSVAARAGGPALEVIRAAPPAAIGGGIRSIVRREAYRVTLPDATVVTVWLLRSCPPGAFPGDRGAGSPRKERVNFDVFAPGSLLGLAVVSGAWTDSRGQGVYPGVYTLRYAIQPIFKDHLGVSEFRDFALLVPAEQDDLALVGSQDEAIARSRAASGGTHPVVLGLLPVGAASRRPALKMGEAGEWILSVDVCGVPLGIAVSGGRSETGHSAAEPSHSTGSRSNRPN